MKPSRTPGPKTQSSNEKRLFCFYIDFVLLFISLFINCFNGTFNPTGVTVSALGLAAEPGVLLT